MKQEDLKKLESFFKDPLLNDDIKLLNGGFSTASNYRIMYLNQPYFVRIMSQDQLPESREKECFITDYAANIEIGPKVYYLNPNDGIIITDFINGRMANYDDLVKESSRNLIIDGLKKLHQIKKRSFPKAILITEYVRSTFARIESFFLNDILNTYELNSALLKLYKYEQNASTDALIHNDFNPNNILFDGKRYYFIDWTNAGSGDPFSDISWHALICPQSIHEDLLKRYFGYSDSFLRGKLTCYYAQRLFLQAFWNIEQSKKLTPDYENILNKMLKEKEIPEPHLIAKDISENKKSL